MHQTENEAEYIVSIRITFPEKISAVLKQEKDRFVREYGSGYTSEPHITLYIGRYTEEGFSKLIRDLQELSIEPFTISLLKPKVTLEGSHHNFYVVDISNKEQLRELHAKVLEIAVRYRSTDLREKDRQRLEQKLYGNAECENLNRYGYARVLQLFEPHITLGEIDIDDPQPELADVQKNLKEIEGEKIVVSNLTVFFHGRKQGEGQAKLLAEVTVPLQ
jgi:2'-5' RNA ligase